MSGDQCNNPGMDVCREEEFCVSRELDSRCNGYFGHPQKGTGCKLNLLQQDLEYLQW